MSTSDPLHGKVEQISISPGGVPKKPVQSVKVTREGVTGDDQNDKKHHGGPMRAVCLFSREIIDRLRDEGHPIEPGSTGENLTISGLDWERVMPGCRLKFEGGVELEITSYTEPCSTIRDAFADKNSKRIKQELHPGESRVYAKVLSEGDIAVGEGVELCC